MLRNERQTYDFYRAAYLAALERVILTSGGGPTEARAEVIALAMAEDAATASTGSAGFKVEATTGRFVRIVL